jgi:hypothetical protein
LFDLKVLFSMLMEGKNTMKPGEGTQRTDEGKGKEVNSREGSPPLQTDKITHMEPTGGSPKTAVEYVAGMAQRVLTQKPEISEHGYSSDSSDRSEAWHEARKAEKRKASREPEGEEHETKQLKRGSEEEGNRTPESQGEWPEYNPAAYASDASHRAGSEVSSRGDFQDEMEMFDDHVKSYEEHKKENGKVLDAVLESEKVDRNTIEATIRNIRNMDTEDVGTATAILKATNQQLDRIVNTVEIETSASD